MTCIRLPRTWQASHDLAQSHQSMDQASEGLNQSSLDLAKISNGLA